MQIKLSAAHDKIVRLQETTKELTQELEVVKKQLGVAGGDNTILKKQLAQVQAENTTLKKQLVEKTKKLDDINDKESKETKPVEVVKNNFKRLRSSRGDTNKASARLQMVMAMALMKLLTTMPLLLPRFFPCTQASVSAILAFPSL